MAFDSRPNCSLWSSIVARVQARDLPSPLWSGKGVLKSLRELARARGGGGASRSGARAFRHEGASAVTQDRCSFAQLLKAGQWPTPAYRLRLDPSEEEAHAIASILVKAAGGKAPGAV